MKLNKTTSLKSKIEISRLFKTGKYVKSKPVALLYLTTPGETKVGFTVPKRLFKRAVDRNLLKRKMREGFRQHAHLLDDNPNEGGFLLLFMFNRREFADFEEIQNKIMLTLQRLPKGNG